MDKKALLFEMIRKRSEKSFSDGGDGLLKVVGRGVGRNISIGLQRYLTS
ncbi:hypothetical protein POX22_21005 [Escherichia coli]